MSEDTNDQLDAANVEVVEGPKTLEEALVLLKEKEDALKVIDGDRSAARRKASKLEKEIEEKKAKDLEEQGNWKQLAEKLQADLSAKDQLIRDKAVKSAAVQALKEAGINVPTDIGLKLVDLTKLTLSDDGEVDVTDLAGQIEALKTSTPSLFGKAQGALPDVKRAKDSAANQSAFATEMDACKTQKEIDAVRLKYGK